MTKILMLAGPASQQITARLQAIDGVELTVARSQGECLAAIEQAKALLIASPAYDATLAAAIRERAPRLRWIQVLTAGYEGLQIQGVPSNVVITNAGDAWSVAVAEHALALLLALAKQIPAALAAQSKPAWDRSMAGAMSSLADKTMCIVGFGSIGREIAVRARSFGVKVIGLSRSARNDPALDEARPIDDLDEVLGRSDIVVLTVPFGPDSHDLIDATRLSAFKPGTVLINVARGAVVNTDALVAALNEGRLAGAGLDVTDPEPLPQDHSLWRCPNVIITPHVAGAAGDATWRRLADTVARNVERFVGDHPLEHVVSWTPFER